MRLRVNPHLRTLSHLRNTPTFKAENGRPGLGKQMTGARGADRWVEVPAGTAVQDADTGELLVDAVTPGGSIVLAQGGHGGRGNIHFKRSTRRVPRIAGKGTAGEARTLGLTLRLLADIGLVGLPNAGKSTLLSRMSNARPKIADYPFTTLEPKLGIVPLHGFQSVLIADLPGLIQGASDGRGLGQRFLRHIERTRHLLLLIEAIDPDPAGTFEVLRSELGKWSEELATREYHVCYSKIDVLADVDRSRLPRLGGKEPLLLSAHTGEGIGQLVRVFEKLVEESVPGTYPGSVGADLDTEAQGRGALRTDEENQAETEADPGAAAPDSGEVPWPTRWVIPERKGALTPPSKEHEEEL